MRVVKKYVLSEKTLSHDIDGFIEDARNGAYQFDYKYGMEGLKIIKLYLRFIQKEFDEGNLEIARECYKKLLLFLFETSLDHNYFNYEDILGRTGMDFEKIVGNYIYSLIKTLSIENFFAEYLRFAKEMQDYGFESINKTILNEFDKESLIKLKSMLVGELDSQLKEDEYWRYELVYLLLDIYKKLNLKDGYVTTCQKFGQVSEEFIEMLDEYDKH